MTFKITNLCAAAAVGLLTFMSAAPASAFTHHPATQAEIQQTDALNAQALANARGTNTPPADTSVADVMSGFYGNTVVVTGPSFQAHVHYRADHTMDTAGTSSGQAFNTKGTWTIDNKGQLCRSYETPPPTMPNPFCTAATAHKVGDTWSVKAADGSPRNVSLLAGIQ